MSLAHRRAAKLAALAALLTFTGLPQELYTAAAGLPRLLGDTRMLVMRLVALPSSLVMFVLHMYVCMYVCMYVYMYLCMYVCTYV